MGLVNKVHHQSDLYVLYCSFQNKALLPMQLVEACLNHNSYLRMYGHQSFEACACQLSFRSKQVSCKPRRRVASAAERHADRTGVLVQVPYEYVDPGHIAYPYRTTYNTARE
eukprot:scaffold191147_cov40-Prasinocladus_malaysianus.AAC.1